MIKKRVRGWLRSFVAAVVGGGATSVSTWLGLAGAHSLGFAVPQLDWKGLGVVFLSGAVTNLVSFLAKSPIWPESTGDTEWDELQRKNEERLRAAKLD